MMSLYSLLVQIAHAKFSLGTSMPFPGRGSPYYWLASYALGNRDGTDNFHWEGAMKRTYMFRLVWFALFAVPFSVVHAQETKCSVKREPFVNGGVSTGTMTLEQGSVCQFSFKFGQTNLPDSWELVEPPKSGKVIFKEDIAEYQPNAGFAGEDKFIVAVFGKAPNCGTRCTRNGRFEFAVTVRPKS
jgi:hypothetical protein